MNRIMRRTVLAMVAASMVSATTARGDLTFDYNFGTAASGTFTTGVASPQDPGYFLVTSLTVTSFTDVTRGSIQVAISAGPLNFQPGAAFNPITDEFINHSGGDTIQTIGNIVTPPSIGTINNTQAFEIIGTSFSANKLEIVTNTPFATEYRALGILRISPESATVPEPSTAIVAVFGAIAFVTYGWSRHRRHQRRQVSA
jgi:hypothetical protein